MEYPVGRWGDGRFGGRGLVRGSRGSGACVRHAPAVRISPLATPPSRPPPVAKKVDLEASFRACQAHCAEAMRSEADGDYPRALARAETALPLVRESVAFLRRYQKVEAPQLPAVDLILRCAPPLFARRALDAVAAWLAELNRAERAAYADLPDRVAAARRRLALAVRVWPTWPATATPAVAPADAADVARLFDVWTRSGAIARRPGTSPAVYEPVTHPRRPVRGK